MHIFGMMALPEMVWQPVAYLWCLKQNMITLLNDDTMALFLHHTNVQIDYYSWLNDKMPVDLQCSLDYLFQLTIPDDMLLMEDWIDISIIYEKTLLIKCLCTGIECCTFYRLDMNIFIWFFLLLWKSLRIIRTISWMRYYPIWTM